MGGVSRGFEKARGQGRRAVAAVAAVAALTLAAGCGGGDTYAPTDPVGASGFANPDAPKGSGNAVIYLHHSTGQNIWDGGIPDQVEKYNEAHGTDIVITQQAYPYEPYPWENNPYEYWDLWVNHSGDNRAQEQPTLDQIAADFDVVVWKNCFISAGMVPDDGKPDVSSSEKTPANYKLQYNAVKDAMLAHPDTTFVVWTIPPKTSGDTTDEAAALTNAMVDWMRTEWDTPGDNIHLWDYHALALEGSPDGLHPAQGYSVAENDSHPSKETAQRTAPKFANRLGDVMAGNGDTGPITG